MNNVNQYQDFKYNPVTDRSQFEDALCQFQDFKPVKVIRELKEQFHEAISDYFISHNVDCWSATIYPLKKSYKFVRKPL